MSLTLTPLSNFIKDSYRPPMTSKEYQATTRPVSSSLLSPDSIFTKPADDKVDITQRDAVKTYMRNLSIQFRSAGSRTLISSIGSPFSGASQGLYAGVGQLSVSQMSSLIRRYA